MPPISVPPVAVSPITVSTCRMIDLRSDTVTQPSPQMRESMANAVVGDDVYGEDPTVIELETLAAAILDKEAALFVSSGTQSNLLAILAHCQRGDEYLVGQQAHAYKFEAGGAAVLGSVQPQPLVLDTSGCFDLDELQAAIKPQPNMHHFAHSKLLCLENTHDGKVLPAQYVLDAQNLARDHGLVLHLDGARIWNAAVASKQTPAEVAAGYDSVSVCLSKGLGAPVGSVLVANKTIVDEARRWRKMVGGGMRQAGIIAAAGVYALNQNVDRLADDHENAARLARGLAGMPGVAVDGPHTNMVFATFENTDPTLLSERLKRAGIRVSAGSPIRFVCHQDVDVTDIDITLNAIAEALFETDGHA